jgi:hypothetical protein
MVRTALIALCLLLAACAREQLDDCVTGTGPHAVEVRAIGAFSAVELSDRIDLVLERRDAGTIAVEGGAHLLPQIRTELADGVLRISNGMRCQWVRSFKPRITVHVPVDAVEHLVLRGTGDAAARDTVVRPYFLLEQWGGEGSIDLPLRVGYAEVKLHTGAGDARLRGTCDRVALYSGIMAPIDASALQAHEAWVNNAGVADVRVRASSTVRAFVQSVGDVYCAGPPTLQVESTITGSGRLIRVD